MDSAQDSGVWQKILEAGALLGGGASASILINRLFSRRKENAEARAAEIATEKVLIGAWKEYAEKLEARMAQQESEIQTMRERVESLILENAELRARVKDLEAQIG